MRGAFWLLLVAACGGGSSQGDANPGDGSAATDATADAPMPPGHHYVIDRIQLPDGTFSQTPIGLDLDSDGIVDNKFAHFFDMLGYYRTFSFLTYTSKAIDTGDIVELVQVATTDYTSAGYSTALTLIGTNPVPPACVDANDTTCRHHLDGNGAFTTQATNATYLVGAIMNGTFTGGPGYAVLQLTPPGSTTHVVLPLVAASARLSMISDAGIGAGILGGAIRVSDIDQILLPAMRAGFSALVMRDCNDLTAPPQCGCIANSDGKGVIGMWDISPRDCVIEMSDLLAANEVISVRTADMTVANEPATSIGVGFTAVAAQFTYP